MFINLKPYLTWLGIMLSSKPNDLQNRLNILNNPHPQITVTTPPRPTFPPSRTPTPTPILDVFVCVGRPNGTRYPHRNDCSKYFVCTGEQEIVRPTKCPKSLHFSPTVRLCTLPEDAGCHIGTTKSPTKRSTLLTTRPTQVPPGSNWLRQIHLSKYYNAVTEDRLVIYFDHDVVNPKSILWPISFARDLWDSVLMAYGSFGNNRLYIVLRGRSQSSTLNYAGFLDSYKGHLNAMELGSSDWSMENSTVNTDLIVRNLAHIVAMNAKGVRYPGSEPGWANIFVYDLYNKVNRVTDRDRWASQVTREENTNIATLPMFSRWYLEIYKDFGFGSVLNRFLNLRRTHFAKALGDEQTFARVLNRGEFVHFWSSSAGVNLTAKAIAVFGSTFAEDYQKALTDFHMINYYEA